MKQSKKALSLKTLTKSNVWDIQENDVFILWNAADKDADLKDNARHYLDIVKSAFETEEVKIDKPEVIKKIESRGFKVGQIRLDNDTKIKIAIKKRSILRITDLTYENIHHISAPKLLEVIERNFGGGWDSLSQSIRDIIESGFDVSTTTLPKDRLHKAGGLYEKKVKDGFEVLEISKGMWVEAIFAKEKPEVERPKMKFDTDNDLDDDLNLDTEDDDDDESLPGTGKYHDGNDEEDEDAFDEDKLTEESYRTTFDTDPGDLNLEAEEVADDEAY